MCFKTRIYSCVCMYVSVIGGATTSGAGTLATFSSTLCLGLTLTSIFLLEYSSKYLNEY